MWMQNVLVTYQRCRTNSSVKRLPRWLTGAASSSPGSAGILASVLGPDYLVGKDADAPRFNVKVEIDLDAFIRW